MERMIVKNKLCVNCCKSGVCKWEDKVNLFDEEAVKTPLGVDITINNCKEYKEIE